MMIMLLSTIYRNLVIQQILFKCLTTIAKASTLQANGSGNGNNPIILIGF